MDLTDEQWTALEPQLDALPRRADGRGRPWRSSREVLNGILWILRTGAQWADLPERYPPYQTGHRRFQRWVPGGTLEPVLEALVRDLKGRGNWIWLNVSSTARSSSPRKGGLRGSAACGAKGRSSWQWRLGRPRWSSARRVCRLGYARAEVPLVAPTRDSRF